MEIAPVYLSPPQLGVFNVIIPGALVNEIR
jgi:hypothetical protein